MRTDQDHQRRNQNLHVPVLVVQYDVAIFWKRQQQADQKRREHHQRFHGQQHQRAYRVVDIEESDHGAFCLLLLLRSLLVHFVVVARVAAALRNAVQHYSHHGLALKLLARPLGRIVRSGI